MDNVVDGAIQIVSTTDVVNTLTKAADFSAITSGMASISTEAVPAIILGVTIWALIKFIKKAGNKIG